MPQPATIMNNLIERINEATETNVLTEQRLLAFEDEAYKLRSANIGEGDMVLGIIAAHRGNIAEMRKRFKNAKSFNVPDIVVDSNYGLSLFICGDFSGAIQILSPYVDKDRDVAVIVACCCQYLGLESKARRLFDELGIDEENRENLPTQPALRRFSFIAPALHEVENSFAEDKEIWESLSRR